MDNIDIELQMMNHIKQVLGDMTLKQKQMDKMHMGITNTPPPRPRGRPKLVERTPEEEREKHNQYHKNYYHNSTLSNIIVCEICHKNTTVQKIKRHQKSLWCNAHKLFHNDI